MESKTFDIVILGGGVSSTFLSITLKRRLPELSILIIEKDEEFPQKVGESTSDITALFLRRFDIQHILDSHVQKTGLRFLFNEENSPDVKDVAEFSSPTYDGPNNGFQINRKIFDEQLLQEAIKLGITVYRPATLVDAKFEEFNNELTVSFEEQEQKVNSKWFVDASGRARYLHKKMGWNDLPITLNTGAIFAHFKNVQTVENWNLAENKYWKENAVGDGSLATLHFMRPNAWWWLIIIDETTTSIGTVFNNEAIQFEDAETYFNEQIQNDAQLSSIVKGAENTRPIYIETVPYQSEKLYDNGQILIGDSGAFVDPMVSPGIELICQQVLWISDLLEKDFKTGKFDKRAWRKYEKKFTKAFRDRMDIYRNLYKYMHSYDLSSNWLQLGLFAYFGLLVFGAFLFPKKRLKVPLSINPFSRIGYTYMVWRLDRIVKKRKRQGRGSNPKPFAVTYSSFYYPTGVFFYTIPARMFFKWLGRYIALEFKELRYIFKSRKKE